MEKGIHTRYYSINRVCFKYFSRTNYDLEVAYSFHVNIIMYAIIDEAGLHPFLPCFSVTKSTTEQQKSICQLKSYLSSLVKRCSMDWSNSKAPAHINVCCLIDFSTLHKSIVQNWMKHVDVFAWIVSKRWGEEYLSHNKCEFWAWSTRVQVSRHSIKNLESTFHQKLHSKCFVSNIWNIQWC